MKRERLAVFESSFAAELFFTVSPIIHEHSIKLIDPMVRVGRLVFFHGDKAADWIFHFHFDDALPASSRRLHVPQPYLVLLIVSRHEFRKLAGPDARNSCAETLLRCIEDASSVFAFPFNFTDLLWQLVESSRASQPAPSTQTPTICANAVNRVFLHINFVVMYYVKDGWILCKSFVVS